MSETVTGNEHWTRKGDVRLFLWEKYIGTPEGKPAVLFVHGSSMATQPTFDLNVPGRRRSPSDARSCRSFSRRSGGRSIARSSSRSSRAITRNAPSSA